MTEDPAAAERPGVELGAGTAILGETFSIGRVLSITMAVLGRNAGPFLLIALTISIPYILLQTWVDYRALQPGASAGAFGVGTSYAQAFTFSLVQAALTYGTLQDLRGQPAGVGECMRRGLTASSQLIGAALLYGLGILAGVVALIVPALVLYVMWWVYVPALVVENLNASAAFGRSRALTKGRRWPIFGLTAAVFVVYIAAIIGVALALGAALGGETLVSDLVVTLLVVLFTTFSSVLAAVGYYALRNEKEGIAVDDLARVFD